MPVVRRNLIAAGQGTLFRVVSSAAIGISFSPLSVIVAQVPDGSQKPIVAPMGEQIAQSCFGSADNRFSCTLRADKDPKSLGAAQPASATYIWNRDSASSFAIQAAGRATIAVRSGFVSLSGSIAKNTLLAKQQSQWSVGTGYLTEWTNQERVFTEYVNSNGTTSTDFFHVYFGLDASVVSTGIFGSPTDTACVTNPQRTACQNQALRSARFVASAAPYMTKLDADLVQLGGIHFELRPTMSVFHDEAMNAKVELLSGETVTGGVTGASIGTSLSLFRGPTAKHWSLVITGLRTQAWRRASARRETFERSTGLFSVSVNRALAGSLLADESSNRWIPALSLTYTNGADPLAGRAAQQSLIAALTLKY